MQILQRGCDPADFLRRVERSSRSVLMLDYDGTLAPFRLHRKWATPYPAVRELLDALMRTTTRVVVISGRPAAEVGRLLGMSPRPEIWGAHGMERLFPDGRFDRVRVAEQLEELLELAMCTLENEGTAHLAERKSCGIALHWRGLPEELAAEVRTSTLRAWQPILCAPGIRCNEFDGGIELKVTAASKERPVRAVLAEELEGAPAAYMGDDLTDEDAFCALQGRALTVLVRGECRITKAGVWMRPPEELVDFLSMWNRTVRGVQ